MHRKNFEERHAATDLPHWKCPNAKCEQGILKLTKGSMRVARSGALDDFISVNGYDPEYDDGSFSAMLECVVCGDDVLLVGKYLHQVVEQYEGGYEWEKFLFPKFFEPAPPLISIPPACPESVREALADSFALYWQSPSSAANSVRIALERLMDELGVPEMRDLHKRIESYSKSNAKVKNHLLAAKWVGNHGSHGKEVLHGQVLDVLEIVESALAEIYPRDHSRITALAASIVAKRGPV
ncbi:DUF4145 domain-containing protein [Cupriavidus sp. USMAA2-4]|uniref:DUF4145 domain-containing protein n=1 Tax=Cupriavidus sp. USMAA2-4 TaxID=876364 RepID=UPI000A0426E5|nr:DUF4145 domain-containing protein [Cupriavidus sp. USMAA2-4]